MFAINQFWGPSLSNVEQWQTIPMTIWSKLHKQWSLITRSKGIEILVHYHPLVSRKSQYPWSIHQRPLYLIVLFLTINTLVTPRFFNVIPPLHNQKAKITISAISYNQPTEMSLNPQKDSNKYNKTESIIRDWIFSKPCSANKSTSL